MKFSESQWVALTLLVAGSLCAQDYEIKFERVTKPGQKCVLNVTGTQNQSQLVRVDGQVMQQDAEEFKIDMEAESLIVTVDERGKPTRTEYALRTLTRTDGEQTSELLPAGKVVVFEPSGNAPPYALKDGGKLEPRVLEALDIVISGTKKTDNKNDELIFGATERKPVGAEWPMNAELAAQSLSSQALKIAAENLSGTVRVAALEKCNEIDCLRMEINMVAKDFEMPMPPGMKVESAMLTVAASGLFPVDTTLPRQNDQLSMEMSARAKGQQNGKTVEVEILFKRAATEKKKFIE